MLAADAARQVGAQVDDVADDVERNIDAAAEQVEGAIEVAGERLEGAIDDAPRQTAAVLQQVTYIDTAICYNHTWRPVGSHLRLIGSLCNLITRASIVSTCCPPCVLGAGHFSCPLPILQAVW